MKEFLVLYMADQAQLENIMRNSTPQQQQNVLEAWGRWMETNQASLVDEGAPLGRSKRVDLNGVSDSRNPVGGYSIVQAESVEAAARLFGRDQPHLQIPGAWVEIIECVDLPGV